MDKWIKENKIATGTVVVVVLLLGVIYIGKQPAQEKQAETVSQSGPGISLQEKCAKQALQAFNRAERGNEMTGYSADYTNHYNQKLGKCFIEIHAGWVESADTIWNYKTLSDAYEGKVYGDYSWVTQKGKKYWEVPPYMCFIYPDGDQSSLQVCKTEAEFDAFVKNYMEN